MAIFIPYDERTHGYGTPYPRTPGEFRYETIDHRSSPPPKKGEVGRLNFACPLGHGNCGAIVIGNQFKPAHPTNSAWTWDGNVEKPTLTPSINCLTGKTGNKQFPYEEYGGCGWHAYLRAGVFG